MCKYEIIYSYSTDPDSDNFASALLETYDLNQALAWIKSLLTDENIWDLKIDKYD